MDGYSFPDSTKRPRLEGFATTGDYYKYQTTTANASAAAADYNSLRAPSGQPQSSLSTNLFSPMHQQTGMTNYSSAVSSGLHYDSSQYPAYRHTPPLLHHRNQYKTEVDQKPFTSPFAVESALPSVSSYSPMTSYSNSSGLSAHAQSQYSADGLYRTPYGGSNIALDNAYHVGATDQKPQNNWLCSAGTFGGGTSMTGMPYQNMASTAGAMSMERNFPGSPAGYKFSPYHSALDHHLPPSNSPSTPNMYSMLPKMESAMGTASMGHMGAGATMFNSSFNSMYGNPMNPNSSCQYGNPYGQHPMHAQNPYGPPGPPAVPLMNPRWQYDFRGYAEEFLDIELRLSQMLSQLRFGGQVTYIYNPVQYAYEPHSTYVKRFCQNRKRILFLGMNPGPYGMAQTGVPFGEIKVVKDWLKITGEIHKPPVEHPKKPIWGFDCPRSEVSGQRFWGLFTKICKEPEAFFENCFVHGLCPLIFINHTGKSLTPPDLPAAERRMLLEICERAVCEVVQLLGIEIVIGVGKFAQERARVALKAAGMEWIRVETIMHPSPANPLANKGWDAIAEKQLEEMGAMSIIKSAVPPTPPPPPVSETNNSGVDGSASNSSNNPQTPTSQGTVPAGGLTSTNPSHVPNATMGNGGTHMNTNNPVTTTTSHVSHNNTSTKPHLATTGHDPQLIQSNTGCNDK